VIVTCSKLFDLYFCCVFVLVSEAIEISNNYWQYFATFYFYLCSLKPGDNATGMFTFTVDMPNGFTVNLDEEKQRNSGAQLVEMDQDKVNVYYDSVSALSDVFHSDP